MYALLLLLSLYVVAPMQVLSRNRQGIWAPVLCLKLCSFEACCGALKSYFNLDDKGTVAFMMCKNCRCEMVS